jgi:hypothetical protein
MVVQAMYNCTSKENGCMVGFATQMCIGFYLASTAVVCDICKAFAPMQCCGPVLRHVAHARQQAWRRGLSPKVSKKVRLLILAAA